MKTAEACKHEAFLFEKAAERSELDGAGGNRGASPSFWRRKAESARREAIIARKREAV
jgi:hypothetical protein